MPRRISDVFCYLRTFGNERDSEELGSNMELGNQIKGILKSWGEFQPLIHYKAIKINPESDFKSSYIKKPSNITPNSILTPNTLKKLLKLTPNSI